MELWTEKYRPQKLSELHGHEEIITRLQGFLKSKNLPHLLFAGPPGVGKTAAALCIAKELFGPNYSSSMLELNSSDERGIDTIRVKVKEFARTKSLANTPFKIILLDEADALTKEAQQALRRTMEKYAMTTRFILDCNYPSKIIDPIQSRCAVFRFKKLPESYVVDYLNKIALTEELSVPQDTLKIINKLSDGDMRRAVNLLQSAASTGELSPEAIYKFASAVEPQAIEKIISLALKGDFVSSRKLLVDTMLDNGISAVDMLKQLSSSVIEMNFDQRIKVHLIEAIADCEFHIVEGSDEFIQLDAFLAKIAKLGG